MQVPARYDSYPGKKHFTTCDGTFRILQNIPEGTAP
jgi:hypothetical protein